MAKAKPLDDECADRSADQPAADDADHRGCHGHSGGA
jgi:hypothetical protein